MRALPALVTMAALAVLVAGCMAGSGPSAETMANDGWISRLFLGFVQGSISPFILLGMIINSLTDGGIAATLRILESRGVNDPAYMSGWMFGLLFWWSFWYLRVLPAFRKGGAH